MENTLNAILSDFTLHTEGMFAFLEMPVYERLTRRKAQRNFLFKNIERLHIGT